MQLQVKSAFSRARLGVVTLLMTGLWVSATACSHKNPLAPDQPGEPEIFFNWLPGLLSDQGDASQPAHELMAWLDDQGNYPVHAKAAELDAILDRLGNAVQTYRQTGAIEPTDEPILEILNVYIAGARAFLLGTHSFVPGGPGTQRLQQDRG